MKLKKERWKWIPGYGKHYEISTFGRVRSHHKGRGALGSVISNTFTRYLVNSPFSKNGYLGLHLFKNNTSKGFYIHRLVLMTFTGPCPKDFQASHLDGDPKNNRLENLKWLSCSENLYHRVGHKTLIQGEKSHFSKLKEEEVVSIIQQLQRGKCEKDIAGYYKVSVRSIQDINNNKSWKHIPRNTEVPF